MSASRSTIISWLLTSCLLGMCMCVAAVLLTAEPAGGHGAAHGSFPETMLQGRTGSDRLQDVRVWGLLWGVLQTVFFAGCLFLGVRQRGWSTISLAVGGLLYAAAFCCLVMVESAYAAGSARQIVLGLPLPTAIMIYVVGGTPVIFSLLYVLQFDRWILTPDDLQNVEHLAQQQRENRQQEAV